MTDPNQAFRPTITVAYNEQRHGILLLVQSRPDGPVGPIFLDADQAIACAPICNEPSTIATACAGTRPAPGTACRVSAPRRTRLSGRASQVAEWSRLPRQLPSACVRRARRSRWLSVVPRARRGRRGRADVRARSVSVLGERTIRPQFDALDCGPESFGAFVVGQLREHVNIGSLGHWFSLSGEISNWKIRDYRRDASSAPLTAQAVERTVTFAARGERTGVGPGGGQRPNVGNYGGHIGGRREASATADTNQHNVFFSPAVEIFAK